MKVKNIYRKLDTAVEDSFEAKVEYCEARKDLTMISHMVNEYHDEYVFEGADGYVTVHNALKSNFIRYGYGWDNNTGTMYNNMPTNWSYNGNTGGGAAHNHGFTQPTFTGTQATLSTIQTSKVVYRWHRTA
jgi:hypothetical protein